MEFFAGQGGYGREAAIAAAGKAEDVLHFLVAEVPQCCQEAAAALRLLSGEPAEAGAPAEELPHLGPALAPSPSREPTGDLISLEAGEPERAPDSAPEPLEEEEAREVEEEPAGCCEDQEELLASVEFPEVLDSAPRVAWHPMVGPEATPAWQARWAEELAVPYEPPQPGLGYHWLDKSAVETLSFAAMEDAFQHLNVHVEGLKQSCGPALAVAVY